MAWIIYNFDYQKVRDNGKPNYMDITPAPENAREIRKFLQEDLSISEIIETVDGCNDDVTDDYRKIEKRFKQVS